MRCEEWREILSARLDGEASAVEDATVEAHLDGCAGCRRWLDQAAAVTRRTRTSLATTLPDLTEAILAAVGPVSAVPPAAPAPFRWRLPRPLWRGPLRPVPVLRAALGLVGAVQLLLGLAQIGWSAGAGHHHGGEYRSAIVGHLWHESAAWNVAVGAGYLFVAMRRTRPVGLLPMLSAFVLTLSLLSIGDLIAGQVDLGRLVSHGFLAVGYLLVMALSRPGLSPAEPPDAGRPSGKRWRAHFDVDPAGTTADRPVLRLVPPPTADARAGHGVRVRLVGRGAAAGGCDATAETTRVDGDRYRIAPPCRSGRSAA